MDVLYWILPVVFPHWPTGTGRPLDYARVGKSFPAPCSDDTTSEQPVMIGTPLSSNTQLEKQITALHYITIHCGWELISMYDSSLVPIP